MPVLLSIKIRINIIFLIAFCYFVVANMQDEKDSIYKFYKYMYGDVISYGKMEPFGIVIENLNSQIVNCYGKDTRN